MPLQVLPKSLTTAEALERLIQLLLEKETLRRSLNLRDFGPRVTEPDQAQRLLAQIISFTQEALDLGEIPQKVPKLVLTSRLSRLPRHIVVLYLLLLPVSLLFLYLSLSQPESDAALWLVRGAIIFLLITPLLLYRRTRINIEHECGYVRDSEGRTAIVIDQLPTIQFLSYLAHEYAHHLYFERFGLEDEEWRREGWARLAQWQVMKYLSRLEGDPRYLHHTLIQVIGELKFACQLISKTLRRRVPWQLRRIRTIYQLNPIVRLLTGTPGFNPIRLIDHAVGTAVYFLEAEHQGPEKVLRGDTETRRHGDA